MFIEEADAVEKELNEFQSNANGYLKVLRNSSSSESTILETEGKVVILDADFEKFTKVSDDEVKKAHKRLMLKYHPDRLASQGLTPEMIKLYTEKAKDIQAAFDLIKKERGM